MYCVRSTRYIFLVYSTKSEFPYPLVVPSSQLRPYEKKQRPTASLVYLGAEKLKQSYDRYSPKRKMGEHMDHRMNIIDAKTSGISDRYECVFNRTTRPGKCILPMWYCCRSMSTPATSADFPSTSPPPERRPRQSEATRSCGL